MGDRLTFLTRFLWASMQNIWSTFWSCYERNYVLNVSIALGLFLLQIVHLGWLGGDVIAQRLTGIAWFDFTGIWQMLIVLVDYTEIPAIFSMTLVYVDAWRRGAKWNAIIMLTLLHSQWLHIFWITDEFIVDTFSEHGSTVLPIWLAWVAILIDYLEVPVIIDTARKLVKAVRTRNLGAVKVVLDEE